MTNIPNFRPLVGAKLENALRVLAAAHTNADDRTGFIIKPSADFPLYTPGPAKPEYTDAWRVVREHLGMQTSPTNP